MKHPRANKPQRPGNQKWRGKGKGKGKGGKNSLDFLDEDDGGHFGLLQHNITSSDLKDKKWVKVDMGDLAPEGMDLSNFANFTGIEELDSSEYGTIYPKNQQKKRKAKVLDASNSDEVAKKSKKAKKSENKAQKSDGQKKEGQKSEGQKKEGQKNEGQKSEGQKSEAKKSEAKKVKEQKPTSDAHSDDDDAQSNSEAGVDEESEPVEAPKTTEATTVGKEKTTKGKRTKPEKKPKLEKEITPIDNDQEEDESIDMSQWKEFLLHPKLTSGLRYLHFTSPTEIQKKAIPFAFANKDIVAAAETGSGKTLAFGLPILHNILYEKERNPTESTTRKGPLAIIISPTRELATQIVDHLKAVSKFTTIKDISVVPIIGGMSLPKQVRLLSYKPDIVVATPGRLWDLHESGNDYINHLESAKWVVLDEADRLIQGNHFKEMDMLFEKLKMKPSDSDTTKQKRQIFLFSATLIDQNIQIHKSTTKKAAPTSSIAKLFSSIRFHNPVESIDITKAQLTASNLREAKIFCEDSDKDFYVYYLLQRYRGKTIVFVNSIHGVKRLTSLLRVLRISAYPLFSDMEQRMRLKNLDRFRSTERSVLVATDVAARGLDIPDIDHVIHFQVPLNAETYVHRSGRTARANRDGIAVMLISPQDQKTFMKIFTVLKKDPLSVLDFPVDPFFMPAIRQRVQLAHQIELAAHRSKKVATEKQWLERNLRLAGEDLKEYFPDSDDEDDKAITAKKMKKRNEQNVNEMKGELDALLCKPLLPVGINRNYVTATHFSTKLLVDPSSFHTSMAITDLESKDDEDLGLEDEAGKGKGKGKGNKKDWGKDNKGKGRFPKSSFRKRK